MTERLISRKEAAEILGIPDQLLYMWARQGKVPSVVVENGRRRYPESAIHSLRDKWSEGSNDR